MLPDIAPARVLLVSICSVLISVTSIPATTSLPIPEVVLDESTVTVSWEGQGSLYRSKGSILNWEPIAVDSPYREFHGESVFYKIGFETLGYRVVDTNQTSAYDENGDILNPIPGQGDPYSGQDAAYRGNDPSYRDNGDGTVTDKVTGLMWQQVPPEAFYSWSEAQTYADNLDLGGYDDWRLPTMKELLSLADFTGSSRPEIDRPYISTTYFTIHDPTAVSTFIPSSASRPKRNIDGQFWSSDAYVGRTMNNDSSTFGFNFIDGRIKGYPNGIESGPTGTSFVRCVRGNPEYGINEFTDNGDGTITDLATGLMWLMGDSGAFPESGSQGDGTLDWIEALEWSEGLEYAGYDDWRLPNAKELHTLVDYTRAPDASVAGQQSAAIDPVFGLTETESWFWTSTSLGDDLYEWALYICFGRALAVDSQTGLPTINAHGAGAMRSDPKTGLPEDYTGPDGGHGPQNDQVRVFNYARPVRTAISAPPPEEVSTPNILLMIVDDWGVDSSSLYNDHPDASLPPMPNLSSLADVGMVYDNAYALPTCSPTRATILTGRYPSRHGIGTPVETDNPLAVEELTLPDIFTQAGSSYDVAAFGKWHLTAGPVKDIRNTPNTVGGWEHYAGSIGGGVPDYADWTKVVNGVVTRNVTDYPTTDTVNDALSWIQGRGESPWFAWVAFNAAHTPFHVPPEELHGYTGFPEEIIGRWRRPAYEAALEALDTEMGRLLDAVDLESTFVILLGDNGSPGAVVQLPFEAGSAKGSLYEGGVHVPMVVAGPGIDEPGRTDHLAHCADLFATILELVGIDPSKYIPETTPIDSVSMVPGWENGIAPRETVFSEAFGGDDLASGHALRDERYKLLRLTGVAEQFFDLEVTPDESEDLLLTGMNAEEQARYEALSAELDAIIEDFLVE